MAAEGVSAEWATGWSVVHRDGRIATSTGERDALAPWASVSKLVVALLVGRDIAAGKYALCDPLGPEGSTIAHLLSHSSGLAPDASALRSGVGRKRIYSTFGYEIVVEFLGGVSLILERAHDELHLTSVISDGTSGGGLFGTLEDLEEVAMRWLGRDEDIVELLPTMTRPFLPDLEGVVPGFGRFSPCPWGIGPQVRGDSPHWMGENWPTTSFGHFGQSGSLLLVDPERDAAIVAVSDRGFGSWAVSTWPTWTARCHDEWIGK
jgi:CubicO group peptidase (beta-lactamase class C family)